MARERKGADPPPGKYALCGECFTPMEKLIQPRPNSTARYYCSPCDSVRRLFGYFKRCPSYAKATRAIKKSNLQPIEPLGG